MHDHDHDHDHDGHHPHDHDHDHAPDHPAAASPGEILETALRELLIEKGVLTPALIQARMDMFDSRSPALGAKVVAKAWADPAYEAKLLADARGALDDLGIDFGFIADLEVVKNTEAVHHVVVCTLCSCYPRGLLGSPPAWYKSAPYRSRTVNDPRGVLAEFGTDVPASTEIRVLDSTADVRYLVLPPRPKGTEGWSEEQLATLVTRDSLIGVAHPAG